MLAFENQRAGRASDKTFSSDSTIAERLSDCKKFRRDDDKKCYTFPGIPRARLLPLHL